MQAGKKFMFDPGKCQGIGTLEAILYYLEQGLRIAAWIPSMNRDQDRQEA